MARKLALAMVALLVTFGVVETVLRTTHLFGARLAWTEPDPLIGYRFTPGREYWFRGENDRAISGRIGSLGWRDRDRPRSKPTGTYRVAVLGDSYVEALQVELDSTFAAIAERALTSASAPVEVMNFGRSGMTTSEELLVLERDVLPCEPDLVVLLFVPFNDIADVNPATADGSLRPYYRLTDDGALSLDTGFRESGAYRSRARLNPLKQRSALFSLVAERYNAWRRRVPSIETPGGLTPVQSLCTSAPDSIFGANFELNRRLLVEAARVCRSRGVGLVFASVPVVYEEAALLALRRTDPTFDPDHFDRELKVLADSNGAGAVALTERFLSRYRATGERLHWVHWNYAGHREAAAALVEAVHSAAGTAN